MAIFVLIVHNCAELVARPKYIKKSIDEQYDRHQRRTAMLLWGATLDLEHLSCWQFYGLQAFWEALVKDSLACHRRPWHGRRGWCYRRMQSRIAVAFCEIQRFLQPFHDTSASCKVCWRGPGHAIEHACRRRMPTSCHLLGGCQLWTCLLYTSRCV